MYMCVRCQHAYTATHISNATRVPCTGAALSGTTCLRLGSDGTLAVNMLPRHHNWSQATAPSRKIMVAKHQSACESTSLPSSGTRRSRAPLASKSSFSSSPSLSACAMR